MKRVLPHRRTAVRQAYILVKARIYTPQNSNRRIEQVQALVDQVEQRMNPHR